MAKSKTFASDINPAELFVTKPEEQAAPAATKRAETKKTEKPIIQIVATEKRSKRIQLVITPSLYEKVKTAADMFGVSMNDYCNQILTQATQIVTQQEDK